MRGGCRALGGGVGFRDIAKGSAVCMSRSFHTRILMCGVVRSVQGRTSSGMSMGNHRGGYECPVHAGRGVTVNLFGRRVVGLVLRGSTREEERLLFRLRTRVRRRVLPREGLPKGRQGGGVSGGCGGGRGDDFWGIRTVPLKGI